MDLRILVSTIFLFLFSWTKFYRRTTNLRLEDREGVPTGTPQHPKKWSRVLKGKEGVEVCGKSQKGCVGHSNPTGQDSSLFPVYHLDDLFHLYVQSLRRKSNWFKELQCRRHGRVHLIEQKVTCLLRTKEFWTVLENFVPILRNFGLLTKPYESIITNTLLSMKEYIL